MFIPVTVDPRQLVPQGIEFDGEREVPCLCGKTCALKNVMLVWTKRAGTNDYGYYAACGPTCVIIQVSQGNA